MRLIPLSSGIFRSRTVIKIHKGPSGIKLGNFFSDVKRKTWILLMIGGLCGASANAAFDVEPGDSRSLALGGCVCADPNPMSAAIANPAGLSWIKRLSLEIGYERLYNMPDLAVSNVVLAHPLAGGGIGLNLHSFGNNVYREIETEVSVGRSIGAVAALGATFGYHWLSIRDYGSDGDVSLSLGLQAKPMSNLIWGLWVRNLNEAQIGQSGDPFPQETVVGASYDISQRILALLDVSKQPRYPETYKFGIEAWLNPYLVARAGIQHQPNRAGFGLGILWKVWQIDYGTASHVELGWTHSISLRWHAR
jgi:hypothetical protein